MKIVKEKGLAVSETHLLSGQPLPFIILVKKSIFRVGIDLGNSPTPSKVDCTLGYARGETVPDKKKVDLEKGLSWNVAQKAHMLNLELRVNVLSSQHANNKFEISIALDDHVLVTSAIQVISKASVYESQIQKEAMLLPTSSESSALPLLKKGKSRKICAPLGQNLDPATNALSTPADHSLLWNTVLTNQKKIADQHHLHALFLEMLKESNSTTCPTCAPIYSNNRDHMNPRGIVPAPNHPNLDHSVQNNQQFSPKLPKNTNQTNTEPSNNEQDQQQIRNHQSSNAPVQQGSGLVASFEASFEKMLVAWELLPQDQRATKMRKVVKDRPVSQIASLVEHLCTPRKDITSKEYHSKEAWPPRELPLSKENSLLPKNDASPTAAKDFSFRDSLIFKENSLKDSLIFKENSLKDSLLFKENSLKDSLLLKENSLICKEPSFKEFSFRDSLLFKENSLKESFIFKENSLPLLKESSTKMPLPFPRSRENSREASFKGLPPMSEASNEPLTFQHYFSRQPLSGKSPDSLSPSNPQDADRDLYH